METVKNCGFFHEKFIFYYMKETMENRKNLHKNLQQKHLTLKP